MKERLQLIVAILVASTYAVWSEIVKPVWSRFVDTFQAIVSATKEEHPKAADRLKHCQNCPIFYKPLATCGTPFRDPDLGCFCHMPTKAKTKCNCWLYDNTNGEQGWPKELNDFTNEQPVQH